MRIAMFMPGLAAGSLGWQVHLDFADAVRRQGHEFEIITTSWRRGPDLGEGIRVLREPAGWRRLGSGLAPLLRTPGLLGAAAALRAHLRRHGAAIDLLHVEVAYPHGAAARLAVAASGWHGPVGLTPMGEDVIVLPEHGYGFRRFAVPRALVGWTIRSADVVRCISPLFREQIVPLGPRGLVGTVPLNVTQATARSAEVDDEARLMRRATARRAVDERWQTGGAPIVLSIGRLHPFKGIEVLVHAMGSLPEAVLLIAGRSLHVRPFGDTVAGLRRTAREAGVADRVRILGSVPPSEALDLMSAADVVAVPSHLESLNKVCVEAAAAGTPFVVTPTTGIAHWVPARGVGAVVEPNAPAELAGALRRFIRQEQTLDGEAARGFVRRFAPDRIASAVLEMYEEALR